MVCLGNICRSPMAAAVAAALVDKAGLGEQVSVESFGTAGYHVGEAPDPAAVAALRRRGWPVGRHVARRIRAGDIEAADMVLCADRSNVADLARLVRDPSQRTKVALLRSFDPASGPVDQEVPDPWGGDESDFDACLDLIERACRGLVGRLAREAG